MQKIIERQNEERMLKIQYASRHYFNVAETLNSIIIYSILVNIVILFPFMNLFNYLSQVISICVSFVVAILIIIRNKTVTTGANLRNFFDSYVLGIGYNDYSDEEKLNFFETASAIVEKNPQKAQIQISNSGEDTPPGVKNWYDISSAKSKNEAVYKCQELNALWDKKLHKYRIIKFVTFLIISIALVIILEIFFDIFWLDLVLGTIAMFIDILERLIQSVLYYAYSKNIEGALRVISSTPTVSEQKNLQKLINERRQIPILGSNRAHRKNAKKLTIRFKNIQN